MFRKALLALAVTASLVALGSCSDSDEDGGADDGKVLESTSKTIGAEGGTIELKGASLTFPAGALTSDTEITVSVLEGGVPSGYAAQSSVFELEPSGLTFAVPVGLTLPFTGSSTGLAVFLSAPTGGGYERISGTVAASAITANITHFSKAFAGTRVSVGGTLSFEEAQQKLVETYCHVYVLCGLMDSAAGCASWFDNNLFSDWSSNLAKSIAAGRITYDGAKAKSCFDQVGAISSCVGGDVESAFESVSDCDGIYTGTVATQGSCYEDGECANGNYCDDSAATCPGTCKLYKVANETVTADERCDPDLYHYETTCIVPPAVNQSCAPIAPSSSNRRCADDAYCDSATTTCLALKDVGAACSTAEHDCRHGLTCVRQGTSGTAGTCTALAKLNAACGGQQTPGCTIDLVCAPTTSGTAEGTCKPPGTVGSSCYAYYQCNPDLYCTGNFSSLGTCTTKKPVGTTCEDSIECVNTAYCNSSGSNPTNTCLARKAATVACQSAEECAEGLTCGDANVCTASCEQP